MPASTDRQRTLGELPSVAPHLRRSGRMWSSRVLWLSARSEDRDMPRSNDGRIGSTRCERPHSKSDGCIRAFGKCSFRPLARYGSHPSLSLRPAKHSGSSGCFQGVPADWLGLVRTSANPLCGAAGGGRLRSYRVLFKFLLFVAGIERPATRASGRPLMVEEARFGSVQVSTPMTRRGIPLLAILVTLRPH